MEASAATVLWRLFKPAVSARVRAVILPGGPPFTLAFFDNDQMDRVENYDTLDLAGQPSTPLAVGRRRTLRAD